MDSTYETRRQRLRELVDQQPGRGKQRALAERIGKEANYISNVLGGRKRMGESVAREIETTLGLEAYWMDGAVESEPNFRPYRQPERQVPLISMVRASELSDVCDPFAPGEADQWIGTGLRVGPNAFALTVDGPSMTNPGTGDSFPEGCVIIVDPGVSPDAGRYVIAKDVDSQQATFKRLVYDGGKWYLQPLNPSFPTIEINRASLRVIGVVVEVLHRKRV